MNNVNKYHKAGMAFHIFEQEKRSCSFSLAKGRPEKAKKKTLDKEWAAKLA